LRQVIQLESPVFFSLFCAMDVMVHPRILHVFSTFDHGGAEARTTRLINHWGSALDQSVWVGVPSAAGARAALDPALAVAFPDAAGLVVGRPGWARYRRIAEALRGYDLILTYSWGAMDVVMAHRLFARRLRLPPLIHHEDGYTERAATFSNWRRHMFRRIALATAQALIVPSAMLAEVARRRWAVPDEKLRQIANGIDVAGFSAKPLPGVFPGLETGPGRVVIGTVAGLRAVKNLPRLVRAVAATGLPLDLVIVGEGPARSEIAAEAARCGIAATTHLPGFHGNPADFLGHFDIFALSSDSDQYPLAVVEAMAAGLPIAATDVGDVRAMVSAVNQRFIVPVEDETALAQALATLAQDEGLRAKLGAQNRQRAAETGQESAMFSAYEGVYGAALGANHPWQAAR